MALIFLLLNLLFAIFLVYFIVAFLSGAPFVPSTNQTAKMMVELANLKPGMTVYDLGSGEGKLLLLAAEKGAARATGFEINPLLVVYSSIRAFFSLYRRTMKTVWKNFWTADLSDADVVFVYLLPWRMERLEQKLKKELKPGALVVSNSFIFPNWPTIRQDPAKHVYVFKA